jgi:hypothetical protein
VLLVHGGPIPKLGAKNMGVFQSYGELLAASGFVAVAFDHRFLAPARLADAGSDVADLIAHVRTNAASLGVDPGPHRDLGLFGRRPVPGGADARAAGVAARRARLLCRARSPAAAPGAPDSGVGRRCASASRRSVRSGTTREKHLRCSSLAPASTIPVLNGGIDRFVQEALARGATLDLLNHPDGRHGFDILDDDGRTKEILRRALEFLKERLAP